MRGGGRPRRTLRRLFNTFAHRPIRSSFTRAVRVYHLRNIFNQSARHPSASRFLAAYATHVRTALQSFFYRPQQQPPKPTSTPTKFHGPRR